MTRFAEAKDCKKMTAQDPATAAERILCEIQHRAGTTLNSALKVVEEHPYLAASAVCAAAVIVKNPKILASASDLAAVATIKTSVALDDAFIACQRKVTIPITLVGRTDRFDCVKPAASEFSQAFIKARQSVARVVSQGTNDAGESVTGSATAFSVSRAGHFLTNYHVVAEQKSFQLIDRFGRAHAACVIGTDAAHDLAVLRLERELSKQLFKPLRFGRSLEAGQPMARSEEAFSFGYPETKTLTGSLKAHLPLEANELAARAQAGECLIPIHSRVGSSGSPLLDKSARVIGIVRCSPTSSSVHYTARAGVIPGEVAKVLLDKTRWAERL